jgi:hypothetical protein
MLKEKEYQGAAGQPNGQAENIDSGSSFAFPQVAESQFEVSFEHSNGLYSKIDGLG